MSENKIIVDKYMDGFIKLDHEQILSCLTEDIEWELPGIFHVFGKESFNKEIENDEFIGKPLITVTRMIEDNNIVVAEGKVSAEKKEGGYFNAVFCDVFDMENSKIKRLTSYINQV